MIGWRRALVVAIAFLTRLPVDAPADSARDLGRSAGLFPLVGILLGLLLFVPAWLCDGHLPPLVLAALLTALLALLTGGLHLDGVADLSDALGAQGADATRRLEILRDSRIGALGALGLALVVVVKIAALDAVLAEHRLETLVVFPAIGRFAAVLLLLLFPYARRQGLGIPFLGNVGGAELGVATATSAIALWLAGCGLFWPAIVALLVGLGLGWHASRKLGGVTGDVYGAVIEVVEVSFLIAAAWKSA